MTLSKEEKEKIEEEERARAEARAKYEKIETTSTKKKTRPIAWVGLIIVLLFIGIGIFSGGLNNLNSSPSNPSQAPLSNDQLLNQNTPNIKQLSTFPADYIGKSFTLYVNVESTNYYNYGFNDETSYYSLKVWDGSVGGDYDGVYAYLDKTAANRELVNKLLNAPALIKVKASIPRDKYEQGSNAFLKINNWQFQ